MRTRPGPLRRYGFAVLVLLVGSLLAQLSVIREGPGTFALLAFFIVMLSAWYGGLGPGLLMTALTASTGASATATPWRVVRLVLFVCGGLLISALLEALHAARRRAERVEEAQRASIAELERSREELVGSRDLAEAANRARDRFLARLSHELRTPLTPVLATVARIEGLPDLPAGFREDVAAIRRNVELEGRLIDDLLNFTRLDRGELRLDRRPVDAHEILGAALEVGRAESEAKGVSITLALEAGDHFVSADPARLQQAAWYLIANAVRFTPEGGQVLLRTANRPGGRIAVEVSDTGVGIGPELLPRVFDPFVQGGRAAAAGHAGLGLGLTIAKTLIELHGGTLTASSRGPGCGSTFAIELETVPAPAPPAVPDLEATERPIRLLLVEDNLDSLRALTRLLNATGFEVQPVASVGAAFEAAAAGRFDLLVSDIGLPDGSGLDVMRHARERYGLRGIAFSGYGTDEDVRASRDAGFEHHLTKPVELGRLVDLIRRTAS